MVSGSGNTLVNADELFYFLNRSSDRKISNADFAKELKKPEGSYIVLDARENLEYDLGHMSGSLHIRFADLQAGRWVELPKDRFIYVLCWSGIRGKEVTEFLDSKKIAAKYLESGANGWVEF